LTAECFGLLKLFDYAVDGLDALVNCSSRIGNSSDEYTTALLLSTIESLQSASNISYRIIEYPATYDSSNDPALCNAVSADVVVAQATETYLHVNASGKSQGTCAGIIGELDRVYIPAAGASLVPGSLSLGIAPLSRPYEYQNASELAIRAVLSTLPLWLSKRCYASVRHLLCSSMLLSPQTVLLRDAILDAAISQGIGRSDAEVFMEQLFRNYSPSPSSSSSSLNINYTVALPSLPDRSLCLSFLSACGGVMSSLWWDSEQYPSLWRLVTRQCDAVVQVDRTRSSSGVEVSLYPVVGQRQVALRLHARIALSTASTSTYTSVSTSADAIAIDLYTNDPASSSSATDNTDKREALSLSLSEWRTQCPHGYVVPEGDPAHPGIEWMTGTGCATRCR
jgi:hypothetical protein